MGKRWYTWWLGFGLIVLPWVWWPGGAVAFEVPRVMIFRIWALVVVLLSLINFKTLKNIGGALWIVGWLVIVVLASRFTFLESLMGNYYRADGISTLAMLVAVSLSVVLVRPAQKIVLASQILGSSLVSLVAVLAWFIPIMGLWLPNSFWWTDGGMALAFGNPHLLAGYLTVSLAVVMGITDRRLRIILVPLHLLAIGVTQAYLLLGFSFVILGWRRKFWLPTMIFMAVFLWWILRPVSMVEPESRLRIWHRGLVAWTQRPLLGWGWSQFDTAIEGVKWPYPVLNDVYVDKAHSTVVEMLVTTGAVGLITYSLLWVTALRGFADQERSWLFMAMAYLLVCQLNIVSISTELLGWLAFGFGFISVKRTE